MPGFGKGLRYRADLKLRNADNSEEDLGTLTFLVPDKSQNPKKYNPKNPVHDFALFWVGIWLIESVDATSHNPPPNQAFLFQVLDAKGKDEFVDRVELQNFDAEEQCAEVNIDKTLASPIVKKSLRSVQPLKLVWFD